VCEHTRRHAAVPGCATAARVAYGPGSDHADFYLEAADPFARQAQTREHKSEEAPTR
jgi:hypothetical protein